MSERLAGLRAAGARLNGAAGELKSVAIALALFLVIRIFVVQPFTIPSDSMEPLLRVGDYILVTKYSYGWSRFSIPFGPPLFHGRILGRGPQRGDVIVFKTPADGHTDLIKRLVGLPGDKVQVLHGVLMVNGEAVAKVPAGTTVDPDAPWREVIASNETLPGPRGTHTILQEPSERPGETTDVYEVPAGQYFFMGDNRDNSLDSRWPAEVGGVGFVPAENLEGHAQLIVASWRGGASILNPITWFSRFDPSRLLRPIR